MSKEDAVEGDQTAGLAAARNASTDQEIESSGPSSFRFRELMSELSSRNAGAPPRVQHYLYDRGRNAEVLRVRPVGLDGDTVDRGTSGGGVRPICCRGSATNCELCQFVSDRFPESLERLQSSGGTALRIWDTDIAPYEMKELVQILRRNNTLGTLNFWSNNLGTEGVLELSKELLEGDTNITVINAENNKIGARGAEALASALRINTTLQSLELSFNMIGMGGIRSISALLEENHSLAFLALGHNRVDDEGCMILSDALRCNSTLNSLHLWGNRMGSASAKALSNALVENSVLTHLNISGNNVGAEGAKALSGALTSNNSLEFLDLAQNGIGDDGAVALADALGSNAALKTLRLKLNLIGTRGTTALADALYRNRTLNYLDLSKNSVYNTGAGALGKALESNTVINRIELYGNHIHLGYKLNIDGPLFRNRVIKEHGALTASLGLSCYIVLSGGSADDGNQPVLQWRETQDEEGVPVWYAACHDGIAFKFLLRLLRSTIGSSVGSCFEVTSKNAKLLPFCTQANIKHLIDTQKKEDGSTLLHVAVAKESAEALELCKFLVAEIGADFDTVLDAKGRSARSIASASNNANMVHWARSVGTLLRRYKVEDGPAVHMSATCTVQFAEDIAAENKERRQVALKMVTKRSHFERELKVRINGTVRSGEDVPKISNRFEADHAVPLYRYHDEVDNGECLMCLVMPRGDRSLDDVIRAERVAGHDIHLIRHFAVEIAQALLHLHRNNIVHGDVKPRNIIRSGSAYRLIDFDASVEIGSPIGTDKRSSGYCPPELAKVIFAIQPKQNASELRDQLYKLKGDLKNISAKSGQLFYEEQIRLVEDIINRIQEGPGQFPTAHPTFDVWSFGIIMYHMLTGERLFNFNDEDNLMREKEQRDLVQWQGIQREHMVNVLRNAPGVTSEDIYAAKSLLELCLQQNPKDRPQNFAEVLDSKFLSRSVECQWAPSTRNQICVLFSDPLVWASEDGELHPISPRLDFDRERNLLQRCIKTSQKDIGLTFDAATCARLQELANERCGCLHFSGHGLPDSSLVFEDGAGGAHFVTSSQLKKLLIHADPFKMILVSACHSEGIGRAFVNAGVKHVVCCEQSSELNHDACEDFTRSFYDAISKEYDVRLAFDSAKGFVAVRFDNAESDKFKLLPEDGNHNVPIFNADKMEHPNIFESNESIPALPANFLGRELIIYKVVSHLFMKQRLVNLVGEPGSGRSTVAAAVCHYVKDRLSCVASIDHVVYIKQRERLEDVVSDLLVQLGMHFPTQASQVDPTALPTEQVVELCKCAKVLIAFDDVDGDDGPFSSFVQKIFETSDTIALLLVSQSPATFLSQIVTGECINVMPLDVEYSLELFSSSCPLADSWKKKSELQNFLQYVVLQDDPSNQSECSATLRKVILEGNPAAVIHAAKSMDYQTLQN